MRYAKGHKCHSRERILKAAAGKFRREGIAATGMTGIMAEAGLTNGGFYSHFRSKNDLVRQGLERALDEQLRRLEGDALGQLRELSRCYLSTEHRDRPDAGCASAALLPEIGRQPRVIRKAYTARMRELFEQLVRRLPQNSSCRTSHDTAIGIFSVLVGRFSSGGRLKTTLCPMRYLRQAFVPQTCSRIRKRNYRPLSRRLAGEAVTGRVARSVAAALGNIFENSVPVDRVITNYADRTKKAADDTVLLVEYGSSAVTIGVSRDDALHHVDEYSLLPFT
jgi:TetR/AcrR family transcriptional regulator, transcriptional repressor for nem operon